MSSNSLALKGRSDAYTQVDNFLHAYARGGDELVNGHPSYTVDQAAEQILREQASWQKAPGDSVLTLSYSFLTKPNDFFNTPWKYVSDISLGKFSAFSAQQQAQAKLSLQSWADVTNIHFVDAGQGDQGDLTFGNFSSSVGGAAFAFLPDVPDALKGQSWYLINSSYSANVNPANGNYGRQTLTHEIGHTLGLSHPGDYNAGEGDPTYADATYAEDTRAYSVMSYWEEQNTGQTSRAPILGTAAGRHRGDPEALRGQPDHPHRRHGVRLQLQHRARLLQRHLVQFQAGVLGVGRRRQRHPGLLRLQPEPEDQPQREGAVRCRRVEGQCVDRCRGHRGKRHRRLG